jgi:hypothetical protein
MQEVGGSIPLTSTNFPVSTVQNFDAFGYPSGTDSQDKSFHKSEIFNNN